MASGQAIITGKLTAIGQAELNTVQTTCDGRITALQDRCFACWPSSQFEYSLALTFLLPQSWTVRRARGQ